MILNLAEKLVVNNPVRGLVQRFYEAPMLLRMAGRLDGKRVLEVGCGAGVGMEVILRKFGAASVLGMDLDPAMVKRAQRRIQSYAGSAEAIVGDVTAIPATDGAFDAVFDFGIIHHVPNWEKAIQEIRRVLRPGGLFLFEEVSKQALDRWVYRTFFEYPTENRFTAAAFRSSLERNGFAVGDRLVEFFFGDFFAGVGRG
jgi:ubiquinone/menaquinone biosynthesis C-methylase UbiE